MKKIIVLIIVGIALLFASTIQAHIKVIKVIPKDGAVITSSLDEITVEYSKDIRLVKVKLLDSNKKEVQLDFKMTYTPQAKISIPLPKLKSGEYSFSWTVMGTDAHKMQETVNFVVKDAK